MDRDGDGNREELVPALDAAAQTVYAVDFGGVDNLNTARLPMFARVDLRITWRPRGAQSGWELFGEIINLLNRQNAGALEAVLEYDPASDRPKIVEQRDQGIPRIPTVGFRFRFLTEWLRPRRRRALSHAPMPPAISPTQVLPLRCSRLAAIEDR